MKPETLLALAGQRVDGAYNSVSPPIYQTANFRFENVGETKGYDYTRSGNPTRRSLEETLAELDGGAGAVCVSTGMAAVSTTLALLDNNAHVICSHDCYGGTDRLLRHLQKQGKLTVSFVDLTDLDALRKAIRPNSRALWIETPSNPLQRIVDLRAVADVARRRELLVVVDNTFLSPLQQRPLELGADIVVYSTTKYINGHSDVVGGAIVAKTAEINDQIQFVANAYGTVAQPFDCWLTLRGLKTLAVRLERHQKNAGKVAEFLEKHPFVERVYYPGLESHPGHEIAAKQQTGFGGMVTFSVRGSLSQVNAVLGSTNVFALAESLGGVESLIEHPATMSHSSMLPAQRVSAGITDNVIRLSVGIESIDDLLEDLEQALEAGSLAQAERDAA
jgi:cystathionine gamma-synthase